MPRPPDGSRARKLAISARTVNTYKRCIEAKIGIGAVVYGFPPIQFVVRPTDGRFHDCHIGW